MSDLEFWFGLMLGAAAVLALTMAWVVWSRRSGRGFRALTIFMLGVAWWLLGDALNWLGMARPYANFWSDLALVGALVLPPSLWVFVVRLTQRSRWLTPRVLLWLSVIPLLSLFFLLTDNFWGLFWADTAGRSAGVGLTVFIVYGYALMLWAAALLLTEVLDSEGKYRQQLFTLTAALLFPMLVNVLEVGGRSPWPDLSLTPLAFFLTGLLITLSLSRFRLLELLPIARSTLIQHLRDGMLVLDERNYILEANPAALRLLGIEGKVVQGKRMGEVLPSEWVGHLLSVQARQVPLEIGSQHIELRVTPIPNEYGQPRGRLIELNDIGHLKQAELELRNQLAANQILQNQLKEETLRDPLTALHNRRHLEQTLPKELSKAKRKGVPVAVAMLDIDHFKKLNDDFGHGAGDSVLIALAQLLQSRTRPEDTICRYGGEEFALVMPGLSLDTAQQRLEALRRAFERLDLRYGEVLLTPTFSAGIAVFPIQAETPALLLDRADQALYAAKRAGRSRVMLWELEEPIAKPTLAN